MAENITTLLDLKNRQTEFVISYEDLLYLVHGSGTERDKAITIQELDKALPSYGQVSVDSSDVNPTYLISKFSNSDSAATYQFGDINFKKITTKDGNALEAIIRDGKVLPQHFDLTQIFAAAGYRVEGDKCSVRMHLDDNGKPIITLTAADSEGNSYTTELKPNLVKSPVIQGDSGSITSLTSSQLNVAGRANIGTLSLNATFGNLINSSENVDLIDKAATAQIGDFFFVENTKTDGMPIYARYYSDTTNNEEYWSTIQSHEVAGFMLSEYNEDTGTGALIKFSRLGWGSSVESPPPT